MSNQTYSFAKSPITGDVKEMNDFLRDNGKLDEMKSLATPSVFQTLLAISLNWLVVFLFTGLVCFHSWWWLPVALLVIGSRQRALVVLTHDASHFLLAKNRKANDVIANLFLCFPMLKSLKYYRAVHLPHHAYLGDDDRDTDKLHDPEAMKNGWLAVYLKYLLSYDLWLANELKQTFGKISLRHKCYLALWWGAVLSGLTVTAGGQYAASFLVLWGLARAIGYHVITTFIIISDHHGLLPGTLVGYTRNHPTTGFLRWFIHPHNNGLHLAHHLAPSVPFYNLKNAHRLLNGWAKYDAAEQCETYFWGNNSVVHSWGKHNRYQSALEILESIGEDSPTAPMQNITPTIRRVA